MRAIIQTTPTGGLHLEFDRDGAEAVTAAMAGLGGVILKVLSAPIFRVGAVPVDSKGVARGTRQSRKARSA